MKGWFCIYDWIYQDLVFARSSQRKKGIARICCSDLNVNRTFRISQEQKDFLAFVIHFINESHISLSSYFSEREDGRDQGRAS